MKYDISHPTLLDLDSILRLEQLVFEEGVADTREVFQQRIERGNATFFVAKDENGKVMGYVAASALNQRYVTDQLFKDVPMNVSNPQYILVLGLAVYPEYRRYGIARALLERLEYQAEQCGAQAISLTCMAPLVGFYEKNGFCNEGQSASKHGNKVWYNLVKELPKIS